jgi:hypothetical protein
LFDVLSDHEGQAKAKGLMFSPINSRHNSLLYFVSFSSSQNYNYLGKIMASIFVALSIKTITWLYLVGYSDFIIMGQNCSPLGCI